jgi:hypothetical protein
MSACKDCGESVEIHESASKDQQIIGIGRRCGEPIQPEVPGECGEPMEVPRFDKLAHDEADVPKIEFGGFDMGSDTGDETTVRVEGLPHPDDQPLHEAFVGNGEIKVGMDVHFPDGHTGKIVSVCHGNEGVATGWMESNRPNFCNVLKDEFPNNSVRMVPIEEILERGSLLADEYVGRKTPKLVFHYMPGKANPKLLRAYKAPKRAGNPVPKEKPRVGRMPDGTEYEMRHSGFLRVSSRRCEQKEYDFHNTSVKRRLQ